MSGVELYIYDLAQGLAAQFSPLLGFELDGIWHTAIVVYGREWFFGSGGIEQTRPGETMLGPPLRRVDLGVTSISQSAFMAQLEQWGTDRFRGPRYNLLRHNCNHFSSQVAQFLTRQNIPQYILDLPERVMNSPMAALLGPIIENITPHGHDIHEDMPPAEAAPPPSAAAGPVAAHFPQTRYLTYPQPIEVDKVVGKLRDLMARPGHGLPNTDWLAFLGLLNGQSSLEGVVWTTVKHVLTTWPPSDIFPVLDAIRWFTSDRPLNDRVAEELLPLLHGLLRSDSTHTNLQLVLKTLCHFFGHPHTRQLMITQREWTMGRMNTLVEEVELLPNVLQIALASVTLNYTIALVAQPHMEAAIQIVSAVGSNFLPSFQSSEALYRTVVALGTLVAQDAESRSLAQALDLDRILKSLKTDDSTKLKEVIRECLQALQ